MSKSIFLVICVCLSIAGCSREQEVDKAEKKGILCMGIGPDPEGLDPQFATGVSEQNILRSLFEGLVKSHPETLEPVPGVAERWEISPDGKIYTFYLRKNACWSNGDALTAKDFLFSFRRLFTPAVGAYGTIPFFCIRNAQAFFSQEVDFDQVGIKALDDYTLQFTLEQPTPYFLSLLMQCTAAPLHEETLKKYHGEASRDPTWTQDQHFISNGPFQLKHWKVGKKLTAVRNPYYWNQAQVRLNGIRFYPISDTSAEERAYRRGQLHITEIVPYGKIQHYHDKKPSPLKIHPYLGTFYYIFNTQVKPLDDVRVRLALNMAIHREVLMGSDCFRLKHQSAYQLVPEHCQGFHCLAPMPENAERAHALLAEAGYPQGQGFPKLTLIFNTSEGQMYLASAIQEMWKKELNIDVELINLEWKVYLKRRREKQFEIARGGWIGDYNDPMTFLELWRTGNINNFPSWSNVEFDHLLHHASETAIPEERIKILEDAEQILLKDAPLMPIHSSATSHLVHPHVRGWYPNLLDWHPYDTIFFEK